MTQENSSPREDMERLMGEDPVRLRNSFINLCQSDPESAISTLSQLNYDEAKYFEAEVDALLYRRFERTTCSFKTKIKRLADLEPLYNKREWQNEDGTWIYEPDEANYGLYNIAADVEILLYLRQEHDTQGQTTFTKNKTIYANLREKWWPRWEHKEYRSEKHRRDAYMGTIRDAIQKFNYMDARSVRGGRGGWQELSPQPSRRNTREGIGERWFWNRDDGQGFRAFENDRERDDVYSYRYTAQGD